MTQASLEVQEEIGVQKADGAKAADGGSWLTVPLFQWILDKALPVSVCTCGSRGEKQAPQEPVKEEPASAIETDVVQLPAPEAVFEPATPHEETRKPIGTVEGYLERKGLRRWDLLWVSMFVQLDGDNCTVTIYDEDGDGERTLHAMALLNEGLRIKQKSALEWQLVPAAGCTMDEELQFLWRAPDPATAETWLTCLKATCSRSGSSPTAFSDVSSTTDARSPTAAA